MLCKLGLQQEADGELKLGKWEEDISTKVKAECEE